MRLPKLSFRNAVVVTIGAALVAAIALAVSHIRKPKSILEEDPVARLTSSQLWTVYVENELNARVKYGMKVVEISGLVVSIVQTEDGSYYVGMATENPLDRKFVRCFFPPNRLFQVISVRRGQQLTVRGRCYRLSRDLYPMLFVDIGDCAVINGTAVDDET